MDYNACNWCRFGFFKFLVYFKFLYLFLVHHTSMDNPPIVTTHTNGNIFFFSFYFQNLQHSQKKLVYIMLVDTQANNNEKIPTNYILLLIIN